MIQSASSLLFNRSGPACEFRKKFFKTFGVEQVVNLSALRFRVFNKRKGSAQKAVAPACVVVFGPEAPKGDRVLYLSPKLAEDHTDEFDILVEPQDIKEVHQDDGAIDPEVWTAHMWGNRRDWTFIKRLRRCLCLEQFRKEKVVDIQEGLIPSETGDLHEGTVGRRFLDADTFPPGTFLYLDAPKIPSTDGLCTHRETDLAAFDLPQLVVKQGWQEATRRFQAALTRASGSLGILATQSYLSAHTPIKHVVVLEAACLSYNSILAVYFLLLTSSRFASYRPEPLVGELRRVPIPKPEAGLLQHLTTHAELDARVRQAFGFKDAEWVLVEDLFNITLPDRKGDEASPGRLRTDRIEKSLEEPQLRQYCEYFIRVLKAGFGRDKQISATIFQEKSSDLLPFRLVAFRFDQAATPSVQVESLDTPNLLAELETLNKTWLKSRKAKNGDVYHQRTARIYDRRGGAPTVFILKPDACRYWTRSMGLHDADEVAADFFSWQTDAGNKNQGILFEGMRFGKGTESDQEPKPSSANKHGRPA